MKKLSIPGLLNSGKKKSFSVGLLNLTTALVLLLGFTILLLFGAGLSGKATILSWMLACSLAGALIGFLFGIPKVLQGNQAEAPPAPPAAAGGQANTANATADNGYRPVVNTNLTEISDWLTKIIVGLGLVNLTKIPPYLRSLAQILSNALSDCKCEGVFLAFAYSIIVTYFIFGFLAGYIVTRLYLAGALVSADRDLLSRVNNLEANTASNDNKTELALARSSALEEAIQQGGAPRAAVATEPWKDLILEYNNIRRTMQSSSVRTKVMTEVFAKMTTLAGMATGFNISNGLKDNSDEGGTRLYAYASLYAKPDAAMLDELVDALVTDSKPFTQYWAIQTIGKIVAKQQGLAPSAASITKLKAYYLGLKDGVDRKYELDLIFPFLKQG